MKKLFVLFVCYFGLFSVSLSQSGWEYGSFKMDTYAQDAFKALQNRDNEGMKKLFQKSAKAGNAIGQYFYAFYCFGVNEKDRKEALTWYEKSAAQGYMYAQYQCGRLSRDKTQALNYYQQAANQGYSFAQYECGRIYEERGLNIQENFEKAMMYYEKSANQGHWASASKWIDMYYSGSKFVKKDCEKLVRILTDFAYSDASNDAVGTGSEQRNEPIIRSAKAAQSALADLYAFGNCVNKDEKKAVELHTKAASTYDRPPYFVKGNFFSLWFLADAYDIGSFGVKTDYSKALQYYADMLEQRFERTNESVEKGIQVANFKINLFDYSEKKFRNPYFDVELTINGQKQTEKLSRFNKSKKNNSFYEWMLDGSKNAKFYDLIFSVSTIEKGQYSSNETKPAAAFLTHEMNGEIWFSHFSDNNFKGLKVEITNSNAKYIEGYFEGKAIRTSTGDGKVFNGEIYIRCRFFLHVPR
jgi:TPR repeat protein